MDVMPLLHSKNRCLKRYLGLSQSFLKTAESGDLSGLTEFQEQREIILKAIGLYDRKISEAVTLLPVEDRTGTMVAAVRKSMDEREQIVHAIVAIDDEIIILVDREKSKIARELTAHQRSREMVGKFKSAWIRESGEEIDEKL